MRRTSAAFHGSVPGPNVVVQDIRGLAFHSIDKQREVVTSMAQVLAWNSGDVQSCRVRGTRMWRRTYGRPWHVLRMRGQLVVGRQVIVDQVDRLLQDDGRHLQQTLHGKLLSLRAGRFSRGGGLGCNDCWHVENGVDGLQRCGVLNGDI